MTSSVSLQTVATGFARIFAIIGYRYVKLLLHKFYRNEKVRYNEQLDTLYNRIMQHFLCILASHADSLLGFVTRWGGLRDQQKEHIPAFVLTTAYFDKKNRYTNLYQKANRVLSLDGCCLQLPSAQLQRKKYRS